MENNKRTKWDTVYHSTHDFPITIDDIDRIIMSNYDLLSTDIVIIDHDAYPDDEEFPFSITVERAREETDEEYAERKEKEKMEEDLYKDITISRKEYNELVDKAWKYDNLNK